MVQTPTKPLTLEEFLKLPETEPASEYIDEQNLDPFPTLFIDGTADYIEGAKTTGLQAIHLTNGQTIHELNLV